MGRYTIGANCQESRSEPSQPSLLTLSILLLFSIHREGNTADENLMTFVNMLGLVTFISVVVYHFVVADPKKDQ